MIVTILIILFVGVIAMLRSNTPTTPVEVKKPEGLTEAENARRLRDLKVCPPHKWRHHEILDENGNLISWKLVCDICGPIDQQVTR